MWATKSICQIFWDDIPGDIGLNSVTADGIHDTWDCYGAAIIVPPRRNAAEPDPGTVRADHPRAEAIRECERLGREEWKKKSGYHRRSLAETAMYRFKTSFGEKM